MSVVLNRDGAYASNLLNNAEFMAKCFGALNKQVTINNVSRPLKEFSKKQQLEFIYQNRLQQDHLDTTHVLKKQKIIEECAKNGNTKEATEKQALELGKLDLSWHESSNLAQLLQTDEQFYAGFQHLLARDTATNMVISQERAKEIADSRIKFTDTSYLDEILSPATKNEIADRLEVCHLYGEVLIELVANNPTRKELYVQFVDPEARELCILGGALAKLGKPQAITGQAGAMAFNSLSIMINNMKAGTTEQHIKEAFGELDVAIMSANLFENAAYANVATDEDFYKAIRVRSIKINKRTIYITPAKNNDPDEKKALIGF